jgi:tetratricopeptide (TPR) repeat protein
LLGSRLLGNSFGISQGHISYDDTLSKYLPDLPIWANQVTIKHILKHTSGLPDIKYGRNLTTNDAVQQLMNIKKLDYVPGDGYHYGNLHSVLRSMIIEKVSGQPQDAFIKENIFTPAGMNQAFSRINLEDNQPLVAYGSSSMAVAGIDMYVTANDLYHWEKNLWGGNIVNLTSLKEALTPHELSRGATFDFGYFTKNKNEEILELFHDGSHPSHYALQSINFDTGLIIVLLSSDGNKSTLSLLNQSIRDLSNSTKVQIPSIWRLTNEAKLYGYPSAIKTYKSLIKKGEIVKPSESMLNEMGYDLSEANTVEDALLLFKLNLDFFPNSANAHDSYAEILIEAGKYIEAKSIAETGLKLAKRKGDDFLIRSLANYLDKIDTELSKN